MSKAGREICPRRKPPDFFAEAKTAARLTVAQGASRQMVSQSRETLDACVCLLIHKILISNGLRSEQFSIRSLAASGTELASLLTGAMDGIPSAI
jgi:hypothetical protein